MHINLNKEMYVACQEGDLEKVIDCLDQGVDPNKIYETGNSLFDDGHTYLMLAAIFEHKEIVENLLNRGAFTDTVERNGYTALILNVYDKYEEEDTINLDIAKILIDNSSPLNAQSISMNTFLGLLSDQDREEMENYIFT